MIGNSLPKSIDGWKLLALTFLKSEFFRFLIAGGVNTVLTYIIYALLAMAAHYEVAFTASYIIGIAISYVLNALFVYRTKLSLARAAAFPLVYLVQYGLGVALLYVLVDWLRMSKFIAPVVIVIVTIPVTFLLSRRIVKQPPAAESISG